jgi:hypothetical protein
MAGEKVGSGRRFRRLEQRLAAKPGVTNPAGLAAAIGRRKYGSQRMAEMAESGRRRAEAAKKQPPKPPAAPKRQRRIKI